MTPPDHPESGPRTWWLFHFNEKPPKGPGDWVTADHEVGGGCTNVLVVEHSALVAAKARIAELEGDNAAFLEGSAEWEDEARIAKARVKELDAQRFEMLALHDEQARLRTFAERERAEWRAKYRALSLQDCEFRSECLSQQGRLAQAERERDNALAHVAELALIEKQLKESNFPMLQAIQHMGQAMKERRIVEDENLRLRAALERIATDPEIMRKACAKIAREALK